MNRVSGHLPDLHFNLSDENGKLVGEQNYRGRPIVLYFGYTGCSAECPITLLRLSRITQEQQFQTLFVSIDPYDTPQSMRSYLHHFPLPFATGLTGTHDAIEALARRLRAADTLPAHATGLYVFDARGRARFLLAFKVSDVVLASAIREVAHD